MVLTKTEIKLAMRDERNPLTITPLLDWEQIGTASVDLRLGHQFIVWKRAAITSIDRIRGVRDWRSTVHRSQERLRVRLYERFVLHPGELVLAATLEYIAIPDRLAATVEGRSSWGRVGLIVATATAVAPGYKGCLTLEIVNSGVVPAVVYPGVRIAQLVLHRTEGKAEYTGSYRCPTGPEFTKPESGWDRDLWGGSEGYT